MSDFYHDFNLYHKDGKLSKHNYKNKYLAKCSLLLSLYVNDGVLIFYSRSEAKVGTNIYYNVMRRLGLTMYRGLGKKNSKTEAVYFPTRNKLQSWIKLYDSSLIDHQKFIPLLDPICKNKKTSLKKMKHILERAYEKADVTKDFEVGK